MAADFHLRKGWDLPFLGSIGLLLFGAIMAYWMKPNEPLQDTEMGTVGSRIV
jgi:hypothetical protein